MFEKSLFPALLETIPFSKPNQLNLVGIVSAEIFSRFVRVGLDGIRPGHPRGGASLADVAVSPLEGLEDAEGLLDGAADGIVVDLNASHRAIRIDDKQPTQSSAIHVVILVRHQHPKVAGDALGGVCHKRNVEFANAAFFTLGTSPRQVGVVRICGDGKHLSIDFGKFVLLVTERNDLRRADECVVKPVITIHQTKNCKKPGHLRIK